MPDNRLWREALKRAIEKQGRKPEEVAKYAKVSKSQVSMMLNGKRDFTQKTLGAILDFLQMEWSDLFCGCNAEKRKTDPENFNPQKVRNTPKLIQFKRKK